jgi:hypothetical protein
MRKIIFWILTRLVVILFFIVIFPFMLGYTLITSFWKVFGATVISFLIIASFGGTLEECMTYSGSLGFFVGVYLTYKERSKD